MAAAMTMRQNVKVFEANILMLEEINKVKWRLKVWLMKVRDTAGKLRKRDKR